MLRVVADSAYGFDEFRAEIEPFRRELLAHCYRITGALHDAEDAFQETLLRAWRGRAGFEERSSLRHWLHRIATNTCLDALRERKARTLPEVRAVTGIDGEWLEPCPDDWIGDDAALGPEARYSARQSTTLAFTIALQLLPAKQRAVLLLRDVLGLSAEEAAETLDTSVASINSALQRARATLDARADTRPPAPRENLGALLARYLRAWESGDVAALVAVLREDALLSMPPEWVRGAADVGAFYDRELRRLLPMRLVETRANGAPAFGVYRSFPEGWVFRALSVLSVADDRVVSIHSFVVTAGALDPSRFGLPALLP
jgi:RNA polymerase sigma-70 factor, ECF subfamily